MGQLFLTFVQWVRQVEWKICFYEQGRTNISSFNVIDNKHILQSPPTLLISEFVAFFTGKSMYCPTFFLQTQYMIRPIIINGEISSKIPSKRSAEMHLGYVIPTTIT